MKFRSPFPVALLVCAGVIADASAQSTLPAPRDVAWPGTIRLSVDATDVGQGVFKVSETIPVASAGPLILIYPQWIPGNHSPTGPIDKLAGLKISASGKTLPWHRDDVEVYAFHVDVPAGKKSIDVEFQFVSPTAAAQGRIVTTPDMLNLQWNTVVLYPAGHAANRISVAPEVKLPAQWHFATALASTNGNDKTQSFAPVTLDQLVDSPLFAGRYFKQVDLAPGAALPVRLDIFGDKPGDVAIAEEQIESHRALVREAGLLFTSPHYRHYDLLLCLSDEIGGVGLEHLQSSENCVSADYLTAWKDSVADHSLLAHEYTHSWNGKYRRGADLFTANFEVPMRNSLLFVYEGQTEYWGYVLATRAGLLSKQEALDAFARTAATYGAREGRSWRSLGDTTNDPIVARRRPNPWRSWQRSEDYYSEGQLIWLDVDTRIRELSGGRRSLDDFARQFFGMKSRDTVLPYTLEDLVKALNATQPYDWKAFLKQKVDTVGGQAPLDGLARGGYRLVFNGEQSDYEKKLDKSNKDTNLIFSLGLTADKEGKLTNVMWDSPAFAAGLTLGGQIIAINGRAFSADVLKQATRDSANTTEPVEVLVRTRDRFRTVRIEYHGGLRYPHLERVPGTPDRLSEILAPRSPRA